jgi:hypothetical protein
MLGVKREVRGLHLTPYAFLSLNKIDLIKPRSAAETLRVENMEII